MATFAETRIAVKTLREIVTASERFLTELHGRVTSKGVEVLMLDSAKVVQVDIQLPTSAFSRWGFLQDGEFTISLELLKEVVRRLPADEDADLVFASEHVRIEGEIVEERSMEFLLTNRVSGDFPKRPSLEFTAKALLTTKQFKDAIKDVAFLSGDEGIVHVDISGDLLQFESKGDEGETQTEVYVAESEGTLGYLALARTYLADLAKAVPGDEITLHMNSDKPIKIDCRLNEGGTCEFVLAPKIRREK